MATRGEDGKFSIKSGASSLDSLKLKNCWHLFVRHTSVVEPSDSIRTAIKIMAHRGFRHLPIVRRGREKDKEILGMVSAQDLIDLFSTCGARPTDADSTLLSRLNGPVSTIMSDDPVTISAEETMLDAIKLMSENNIGALPIVEAGQHEGEPTWDSVRSPSLLGIITLRDIISLMAAFVPFGVRVEDYMSQRLTTVNSDDTIYSATGLMCLKRVRRLPVINSKSGRVQGMVTNKMIVRYFESSLAYGALKIGINNAYKQFVRTIMMSPMPLIDPKEDCGTAAYLMRELGTGGFAVADSRGLLGIITERDLVKRIHDTEGKSFFSSLFSKAQTIYC